MTAFAPLRAKAHVHVPGRRLLSVAPLAALAIVIAADFGSVALVKLTAEDHAGEAARAGMSTIQDVRTPTPQVAQNAFDAASAVADMHDLTIDEQTFVVRAGGTVELTAHRTAPTMLFKHLPGLRGLTENTVSAIAVRPNW